MGYTHYWNYPDIPADVFAKLAEDAQEIVKQSNVPIAGWDGHGEPEITEQLIRFNGLAPSDDYETFQLIPAGTVDFCKTGRQPYDEIVTAILIRAKVLVPDFKFTSDGSWTEDWTDGRALYTEIFGDIPESLGKE